MSQEWLLAQLASRFGWNEDVLNPEALGRALERCRGEAGLERYVARLLGDEQEFLGLAEEFLVPETWFFREPQLFEHLPDEVRRRRLSSPNPVRLLSLPCSSGEEAYSMVIALLAASFPEAAFTIEAVDLSQAALGRAATGIYRDYSFRGGDAYRQTYFEAVEGGWQILPRLTRLVRWRRANLLGPTAFVPGAYDLACCRNLLIYLDQPARERAFRALHSLLDEDGLLYVGLCELALPPQQLFVHHPTAGPAAFRRLSAQPVAPLPRLPASRPPRPVVEPKSARVLVKSEPTPGRAGVEGLRRAIYLDPEDHLAMLELALYEEQAGRTQVAMRLRQRAWRVKERAGW
ncbi:MAG: protein-glutamate O-methyltransferase CheR [Vulcanimicrobiota bacterium]